MIRKLKDSDFNFVLSTWMKSFYEAILHYCEKSDYLKSKGCNCPTAPYPRSAVFYKSYQEKIKSKFHSGEIMIDVFHSPEDEDQIIGWIAYDKECIHYCYVKQVFRKYGIAKKLIANANKGFTTYTHHTVYSRNFNKGLIYDPYKF